jgi:hypothetical protein
LQKNLKQSIKAILFWGLAGFAAVTIVMGVTVSLYSRPPERCHVGFVEQYHGLWGWDYKIEAGRKVPCVPQCRKIEEDV